MSRPVKHSPAADYEAAAELRETLRRFQRRSEIVARSHGLTARIYQLLLMIKTARRGDGRAGFVELEERLQLGKSTITELVQRSEERGFVRRELDSERRAGITVRLTPSGERRLAKAVGELGDERAALLKALARLSA